MSDKLPKGWTADMLETARALAARDVELPRMFVLDKGQPEYTCTRCRARDLDPDDSCCGPLLISQSFPQLVRLPDLRDDENGAALLAMIRSAKMAYNAAWFPKGHPAAGHHATAGGLPVQRGDTLAHAAAKAWRTLEPSQ